MGVGTQKVGKGQGRNQEVATEIRKPWLWPQTGSRELAQEGQVPEISAAKGRRAGRRPLDMSSGFCR